MELPDLNTDDVAVLVRRMYGYRVISQQKLNSTDDINIHVLVDSSSDNPAEPDISKDGYVLKVLNSVDSQKVDFVDAMHAAIECSVQHGIVTPTPVQNKSGQLFSIESLRTRKNVNGQFLVRLFRYIPGELLFGKPCTSATSYHIGQSAAKLDKALMTLEHPALSGHKRHWSLTEVVNLEEKVDSIEDEQDRVLIRDVMEQFKQNVAQHYSRLQKGAIHADLNCENLLVKPVFDRNCNDFCISGVLDFGDLVHEYHVFNLAIAMMYLMGEATTADPIEAGGHLLAGYLASFRLPPFDISTLKECICGRLAQSLVYGAYARKQDPSNTYGLDRIQKKWILLRSLWGIPKNELYSKWNSVLRGYELEFVTNA